MATMYVTGLDRDGIHVGSIVGIRNNVCDPELLYGIVEEVDGNAVRVIWTDGKSSWLNRMSPIMEQVQN